jgi:hypothetical protein
MSGTEKREHRDAKILLIGRQMSNVMFNLAQRGDGTSNIHLAANEYAQFGPLYKAWDEAVIEYRASFKRGARRKARQR